jgi:hypothetical protein
MNIEEQHGREGIPDAGQGTVRLVVTGAAAQSHKLTVAARDEIVGQLLDAGPDETYGLLARLAREHGVSRQCIYDLRKSLEARRLFFSRQYCGFLGRGQRGGRFLVSRAIFQESVVDVLANPPARGEPFTRTEAEEMLLDPRLWDPDEVGPISGVSWLDENHPERADHLPPAESGAYSVVPLDIPG